MMHAIHGFRNSSDTVTLVHCPKLILVFFGQHIALGFNGFRSVTEKSLQNITRAAHTEWSVQHSTNARCILIANYYAQVQIQKTLTSTKLRKT